MNTCPACPGAWGILREPGSRPEQFAKKKEEERGDCEKRKQKEKGDGLDKVAEISTEGRENNVCYCPLKFF